jgi:hypothetical protein
MDHFSIAIVDHFSIDIYKYGYKIGGIEFIRVTNEKIDIKGSVKKTLAE